MKNHERFSLHLLLALAAIFLGASAPAGVLVPLDQIRPTQMEIGKVMVVYSITKIRKAAPDVVDAMATRTLPTSIGPDGKYYIRDGHHWASAADELRKQYPGRADQMRLRLDIEADFRGKSWPAFATYLYRAGVGYFTPAVRAQHPGLWPKSSAALTPEQGRELAEIYRDALPASLAGLKDSAGRSAFGLAIEKMGIVPEQSLQDYIEFYIAEDFSGDLALAGIALTDFEYPKAVSDSMVEKVQALIVTSPKLIRFLMDHRRPGIDPQIAKAHLLKAINAYRAKLNLSPIA